MQRRAFGCAALLSAATMMLSGAQGTEPPQPARWSAQAARAWYAKQPWPVGSNYLPASAINELEMWQAETFNPAEIDKELGWAEGLGMNTMRVFLHDLPWKQDSAGFRKRINTFLEICARHKIKPVLVLFDSVWDPNPKLGPQRKPRPGVHNSGWVQSPGAAALTNENEYPRLRAYVEGVVGAFGKDQRILAWDVWNEPDNMNGKNYADPKNKPELVLALLPHVYAWARSQKPLQPLTSGIWHEDVSQPDKLSPMAKEQLALSDIVSFHNYDPPEKFQREVKWLETYGRPLLCTEYMARPRGSTFDGILPVAKASKVGVINWGFVAGKSQTFLPWDSWEHPYVDRQPDVWFHDIFHPDGSPYRAGETALIRRETGAAK